MQMLGQGDAKGPRRHQAFSARPERQKGKAMTDLFVLKAIRSLTAEVERLATAVEAATVQLEKLSAPKIEVKHEAQERPLLMTAKEFVDDLNPEELKKDTERVLARHGKSLEQVIAIAEERRKAGLPHPAVASAMEKLHAEEEAAEQPPAAEHPIPDDKALRSTEKAKVIPEDQPEPEPQAPSGASGRPLAAPPEIPRRKGAGFCNCKLVKSALGHDRVRCERLGEDRKKRCLL